MDAANAAVAVPEARSSDVVMLSQTKFVVGCMAAGALALIVGALTPLPNWLLPVEIFSTIIGLFVLGSFKYQVHKNALTFGMCFVIVSTFFSTWWPHSNLRVNVVAEGPIAAIPFLRAHLFSWAGIEELFHADTMLFILGLTFFICVIAQTRLLESITLFLLARNKGYVLPTVLSVVAVVAFSSGILDGVSMVGLTIRTLMIVLMLAGAKRSAMTFAVMVCTVVTTVCGMWLAYGEPPNLIMKSNLINPANGEHYLSNAFFLRYCLPGAVASFLVIAWNLRRALKGTHIDLNNMDVIDANAATVRFLQAERHGEIISPIEVIEAHAADLGGSAGLLRARLEKGETFGLTLIHEQIAKDTRVKLLSHYISEDLAESLDNHYALDAAGDHAGALRAEQKIDEAIATLSIQRVRAQQAGALGLAVFVACLILHGFVHAMPLFLAPLLGFLVALVGIYKIPKMRALAIHEARLEFAEYYFLLPLFLSMVLLTKTGFFNVLHDLLESGSKSLGESHVAFAQFLGCTFLSAILDNNIVADFGSRALHGLSLSTMYLFAMAQIAGYAAGGCWTHIGCAQSVVAFAFIRRDIDANFTPVQWIKAMTPVLIQLILVLGALIYLESLLFH